MIGQEASDLVGHDNWPKRWASVAARLDGGFDWETFRVDPAIMAGIQVGPKSFNNWLSKCESIGVPPHVFADNRIGNPKGRMVWGVFATASSLRAGFHAWRMYGFMEGLTGRPLRLLSIGGGFGAFAKALSCCLPGGLLVSLADAVPMQRIQERYLHDSGVHAEPYEPGRRYDVISNKYSFGEMVKSEVDRYFGIIQREIAQGGILYSFNRSKRVTNFEAYPYDESWRHLFVSSCDVFVECISRRDDGAAALHPSESR